MQVPGPVTESKRIGREHAGKVRENWAKRHQHSAGNLKSGSPAKVECPLILMLTAQANTVNHFLHVRARLGI